MTYKELKEELNGFNEDQLNDNVVLYESMKYKPLELVKWPMKSPVNGSPTVMVPLLIIKK